MESTLFLWLMTETMVLVLMFFIFGDGIRRAWGEVRRLRTEKEALTKVLLAFLKGQVETQVPKENKTNKEEHK
mgnify:CR=1 FL=1